MRNQFGLIAGVVVAIVIALLSLGIAVTKGHPTAGGVTNYDEVDATALKVGGTNGTRLGLLSFGTCSLIASNYTVAASSTVPMDCAVTGVVSTDGVFAQFATSTIGPGIFGGWSIRGASASTTAGFVTISVVNGAGGSALIPASIASSTKFIVLRSRSGVPGL